MKQDEKDLCALSTVKNGPHHRTIGFLIVKVGQKRDFQNLKTHGVMWFPITKGACHEKAIQPFP